MSDAPRTVSGKWMILTAFGLAIAMSVGAWLFHYRQQHRPMELWGPAAAKLIAHGKEVQAWRLSTDDEPTSADVLETITLDGQRLHVVERRDITNARGLVHFRSGLLNANCFDWNATSSESADWQYALQFGETDERATILFAPEAQRLRLLESGAEISVAPISEGLESFLKEQFVPPSD
ncbi:MAG: hypothetical protein SGJ19_14845 [Planctomycetia bacterium]|nr:hypothetical protein [Planctomycetia bacterium]